MIGSPDRIFPRLHLVTDAGVLRSSGFLEQAAEVVRSAEGRVALHIRGHELGGREVWAVAEGLAPIARQARAWLVINDRVDVAAGCGADGVQLGRGSIPTGAARAILGSGVAIGVSVHNPAEARDAVDDGADFLLAGTLFGSASHPNGVPTGVDWLREISTLGVPLIGIGGIDASRVRPVTGAGAHGVAVIGAVWRAVEPAEAVRRILNELE